MGDPVRRTVILGLIVILAAAGALGYYSRQYARQNLVVAAAEQTNAMVAESFNTNIWTPAMGHQPRPLCRPACPDFTTQMAQGQFFFTTLPLSQIRVYDIDGKVLLSIGGGNGPVQQQALALIPTVRNEGIAHSYVEKGAAYLAIDGVQHKQDAVIVHSLVPLSANGQVSEVIEVANDVTAGWERTGMLQWISMLFAVILFAALHIYMRRNSEQSESIIESQHDEQADLAAAKAKAEEESVEKSKFLANVSHELRTPLNSIIGFSEILKNEVMGPLGNAQYKEYATDIHVSGQHLLSLINDILDFSKADANKLQIEYQETDITKLMQNCLRLISQRAEASGIILVPQFSDEHVVAHTDPKRLRQVVLNLLSNAVKFTPPGGKVTLACVKDDIKNAMVIAVSDTGVGIAEKDISKVMAPFGQVKNEYSSKSEGTGLGLPLTRKLVELMGGQFSITSKLGEGTRVTLTFSYGEPKPELSL